MTDFEVWLSQSWFILLAVISGVTVVWNFFKKTVKEIKDDISKPFSDINKRFDSMEAKIDAKHGNDKVVIETLLAMQRKSILDSCEKYISKGYANLHQKETLMSQFESYKALGGNSFIHELVDRVNALPIEEQKKVTLNE